MLHTWGLGAGSVPSISGPTAVPSWTLAPMPFSARGRAVKMTVQTHISPTMQSQQHLPPQIPILHCKSLKTYLLLFGDRLRLYGKKREREKKSLTRYTLDVADYKT